MGKSVGNLSLAEKVGQMFMVGIDNLSSKDEIIELIQKYKIGGVVIYENAVRSAEELLSLVNTLKSMNTGNEVPLFIGIAEEGGRANVLPKEIIKLPAIKYIADIGDKTLIYDSAKHVGKILSSFGINMNFWPVFDLGGAVEGKNLEDRCLSTNPVITTTFGEEMIRGLNDSGIIAVPKYFPGHRTTKNSNSKIVIPHTSKSISKLEQEDIMPFKNAMEKNVDAMLVGNINISKLNLFAPATLSRKVITNLLKEKYQYKGVIISDNITTPSVDIQYGIKASSRKAVLAGADLIIVKDMGKIKAVLQDIAKQIRNNNIDSQEIDLRVQKVLDLKDKFNIDNSEIKEVDVAALNDQTEALLERIKQ